MKEHRIIQAARFGLIPLSTIGAYFIAISLLSRLGYKSDSTLAIYVHAFAIARTIFCASYLIITAQLRIPKN